MAMPEVKEIKTRFERMLRNRPDLAEPAALQLELVQECCRRAPDVQAPLLPLERAQQKLASGVPLLHGEPLDPDAAFCRDLFGRLLNILQRRPRTAEVAGPLAAAAATGRLDFDRALGEALADHQEHLFEVATWSAVSPDALSSVLGLVVRPPLQAVTRAFRPLLELAADWSFGYCPVCGAWPGLAELRMTEQHRHLRCLRCGADWLARRQLCPFCGNDDHTRLGYLQAPGELRMRADVCDNCRGYLKAINAFEANEPEYLALEDFASVHLDLTAIEQGYSRPGMPGFRLELGEGEAPDELDDLIDGD